MKHIQIGSGKFQILSLSAVLIIILLTSAACGNSSYSPAPTPTPGGGAIPTQTPSGTGESITIDLIAHNIAFNMSIITVPAGASVTVNFDNQDSGVPHNFAVYENLTGGGTRPVFVGQVIDGPNQITYHFTAPETSGSYFFECDVHPSVMNGSFIVTTS